MRALQKYMNDLDQSLDEIGVQLKNENNVLEALQEYRGVYETTKKTACKGEELPVEDDEELLNSFVTECVESLPIDKLAAFSNKVKVSKAKVKAIDDTLRENDATCATDKTACEDTKKKALADLESVLSDEEKASFGKAAQGVLTHARSHLENCFNEEASDLLNEVQSATNKINQCMASQS